MTMITVLVITQIILFVIMGTINGRNAESKLELISMLEEVTKENSAIRKKVNGLERQLDKLKRSFDV